MADRIRVLYIDDEPGLLEICKIFLEQAGNFSVTTIESAPAALELLKKEHFDVIISDYQMPGMDGIKLLVEVRTHYEPIPFILFTGKGREEVAIQAINSGADFYLQKGGEPGAQYAELSNKINYAVSRKRSEKALLENEKRYKYISETTTDFVFSCSRPGDGPYSIDWLAGAVERITGYTIDELQTMGCWRCLVNPGDMMVFDETITNLPAGTTGSCSLRIRTKNGESRWLEVNTTHVPAKDNSSVQRIFGGCRDITERKQVESDLRASEETLLVMLNGITESAFMMTPEGTVLVANETVARRLGKTDAKDLVGKNVFDLLPVDLQKSRKEKIQEILQSGKPVHFEDSRDDRVMDQTIYPIRAPDGTIDRLVVFGVDITESKRALEALRESEEKFRLITETIDEAFWMADVEIGKIFYASPSFELIWGCSRESLYENPRSFIDAIHVEDRERVLADLEIQKSKKPFDHEYRIIRPDGSTRYIWDRGFPIRDETGQVSRYAGVAMDITGRKQADEAIRKITEFNETLVQASPAFFIAISPGGKVLMMNKAVLRAIGYSLDEVVGKDYLTTFIPDSERKKLSEIFSSLEQGKEVPVNENYILAKDGRRFLVEWHGSVVFKKDKEMDFFFGVGINITERKLAETALKKSESRLSSIIRVAPIGIGVVSNRIIRAINDRFCKITGYDEEELIGKSARFLYPSQEDYDFVGQEKYHQISEKGSGSVETRFQKKDGTIIHVLLSSTPIDPSDLSVGVTFTALDITDRRTAEKALKKSEEFNRNLVENIPDYLLIYDQQGIILYTNPLFSITFGFAPGEAIGTPVIEHIAPGYRDQIRTLMQQRISEVTIPPYEVSILKKDGSSVPVIVKGTHIMFNDRDAVLVLMNDITGWKQAETALIESEEKFRSTIGQSMDGIVIIDENFSIIEWNTAQTAIYGYTKEEMLGRPVWEFQFATLAEEHKSPVVLEKMKRNILDTRTSDNNSWMQSIQEFEVYCKDGRRKTVQASTFPIVFRGVTIFGSFSRDITFHKLAEGTLQRVNQKLNVLSELTRKDLTNQIFVLCSYLELTKNQLKGQEPAIETLQKVDEAIQLIHGTLEYSKDYQEMGAKPPKWQNVKMTMLLGLSHVSIGNIRHSIETENLTIFADPLLEKVCQRLFENSVKHGGHVTMVRAWHKITPGGVTIVFEDDGTGIPQERKELIFLRNDGTRGSRNSLIFSREILDITGITIRETGEPGKGARFEMAVPNAMWRDSGNEE